MKSALFLTLLMLFLSTLNLPGNLSFANADSLEVTFGWVTYVKALFLCAPLWLLFFISLREISRNFELLSSLIVLSVFGILTTVWSPVPTYTLIRAGTYLLLCIDIVLLVSAYRSFYDTEALDAVMRHLLLIFGIITAAFLVLGLSGTEYVWRKIYPDGQLMLRLGGDIIGPNTLGAVGGINLILICFGLIGRNLGINRLLLSVFAASGVYVVVFSGSRGVLVSLLAVMLLFLVLRLVNTKSLLPAGTALIIFGIAIISLTLVTSNYSSELVFSWLTREQSVDEIYTLTGRTDLWKALLNHTDMIRMIIGNGYGVPVNEGSILFYSWKTFNTHNGFLQVLLGMGIVGLLFFIRFVMKVLAVALQTLFLPEGIRKKQVLSTLIVIIFILIDNLVESIFGIQILPQTIVFILLGLTVLSCFQKTRYQNY